MFTKSIRFLQKAAVSSTDARVLLVQRNAHDTFRPGGWDFPGGDARWGELHGASLAREILEETGLQIGQFTPLKVMSAFHPDANVYVLHIIYACKTVATDVTLSGEHSSYGWFSRAELETLQGDSMYALLGLEALKTYADEL